MGNLSPEELVLWCQQTLPDDTRAFEALVAQYKQSVYATAYRLLGNRQEAEDQAQEVFLKVYRSIGKLSEPQTFPAWLRRITVNTCLDALEKQKRRPPTFSLASSAEDDTEDDRDYADAESPSPWATVEQDELRRCLEKALARLEPEGRSALVLRDIEENSYEETAAALQLGLSAVKMRIHRARLALQKLLEQICPGAWRASSPKRAAALSPNG